MRAYGETALIAECRAVAGAEPGSRNVRLNRAAFALGQLVSAGQLDATTAAAGLAAAAQAAGLADAEARAAITSGMRAGAAQPRRPQPAPTAARRPQPAPTAARRPQAMAAPTAARRPQPAQAPAPTAAPQPQQTDAWRLGAQAALDRAQAALKSPGIVYRYATEQRGLAPTTLAAWGCGAGQHRGCQTLCWPVYDVLGQLVAVRHRVLGAGQLRYTATPGSRMAGHAAGSQLLWAERTAPLRCLLIIEGELNAMSAWQIAHPAGLDVVSLGSQAATVPAWLGTLAGRYGAVLTWFDEPARAAAVLAGLGARAGLALHSQAHGGKADANDGLLGGWLGLRLWEARHHLAERLGGDAVRRLCWQYWEAAATLGDDVRRAVSAAAAMSGGGLW